MNKLNNDTKLEFFFELSIFSIYICFNFILYAEINTYKINVIKIKIINNFCYTMNNIIRDLTMYNFFNI